MGMKDNILKHLSLALYPLEAKLCQASNLPERKNLRTCGSEAKGTWGKRKPVSRRKKNPNCPAWVEKHASPGKARGTRIVPVNLEFLVADVLAVIRCGILAVPCSLALLFFAEGLQRRTTMTWTTPVLIEICIGLEINGYMPADGYVPPEF